MTAAVKDEFSKGDVELATKLHSPDIINYFGGDNVVIGCNTLKKTFSDWFQNSNVEFIEDKVESTVFFWQYGNTNSLYAIKTTLKGGGKPVIAKGRSMVVYIRDKSGPAGWLSPGEIIQEAPGENK